MPEPSSRFPTEMAFAQNEGNEEFHQPSRPNVEKQFEATKRRGDSKSRTTVAVEELIDNPDNKDNIYSQSIIIFPLM